MQLGKTNLSHTLRLRVWCMGLGCTQEPMNQLVVKHWKVKAKRIDVTLGHMGVPFRHETNKTFWEANAHQLQQIYSYFQLKKRDWFKQLHPQNGGDPIEFGKFVEAVNQARESFAKRLPQIRHKELVLTLPNRKANKNSYFTQHPKKFVALRMMNSGLNNTQIILATGLHQHTVEKLRKYSGIKPLCGCSRPITHNGSCIIRWNRRTLSSRKLTLKNMKIARVKSWQERSPADRNRIIRAAVNGRQTRHKNLDARRPPSHGR